MISCQFFHKVVFIIWIAVQPAPEYKARQNKYMVIRVEIGVDSPKASNVEIAEPTPLCLRIKDVVSYNPPTG